MLAEGLAMRETVLKCIELGLVSVCFESDSSELINAINEEKIPLEVYGVVSDSRTLSFYPLVSPLFLFIGQAVMLMRLLIKWQNNVW